MNKRKVLSILLSFVLILNIVPANANKGSRAEAKEKKSNHEVITEQFDYSGYEEIATPEDMDKMSHIVNGKYYLSADIDMYRYPVLKACWMDVDIQ